MTRATKGGPIQRVAADSSDVNAVPVSRIPKSVLTTDKIVEAARELFAQQSYANSTLDDVAKRAGFTKGAVYYYFKDKESLLLEVLSRIEARSIDTTIRMVDEQPDATRQLETFVQCQTRWAGKYPGDLALMIYMSVESAYTSPEVRARVMCFYDKLALTLERIIDSGKRSGEFSSPQSTRDIALYLQAVHDGNMMIWFRSGTDPKIGHRLTKATMAGFMQAVNNPHG